MVRVRFGPGCIFAIDSIEPDLMPGRVVATFIQRPKNLRGVLYALDAGGLAGFIGLDMFNEQLAKIEKAKADIAAAEAKLASDRVAALAKLPGDFGYDNLNAFLKAVKAAYGKGGKAAKRGKAAAKAPKAKAAKGKRAKITDEVKAQVKALAEAGKTGQEIAKALGISMPSVQNIKKAFGMVKARSAAPAAAPAAAEAPAEAPASV